MKVYIKSIAKLSRLDGEPAYREFLSPIEARRMSRMMKKAIVVSTTALREAGISVPDAIITGTGLGSLENTEAFLMALRGITDDTPRPTNFMQSTHNTAGSLLGIRLGAHGYNATYANIGTSFESALLDGWMQIRLGEIDNALVSAFEELTPTFSRMLAKTGFEGTCIDGILSETAVSLVLSSSREGALCELEGIDLLDADDGMDPDGAEILRREDYTAVFGNNYSVSALGLAMGIDKIAAGARRVVIKNDFRGEQFARTVIRRI